MQAFFRSLTLGLLMTGAIIGCSMSEPGSDTPKFKTDKPGAVVIKVPGMS